MDIYKDEYLIIRNFLNEEELNYQINSFRNTNENKFVNDPQVINTQSLYNFIPHLEILCNKLHIISESLKEPLLPTYAYCRRYLTGTELTKHKDRPSSEIGVSVHLYGDVESPLYIEKTNGDISEINLQPGDCVIYEGAKNNHWREPYTGKEFAQLFLFYVRSRGNFADRYFDNLEGRHKDAVLMERNRLRQKSNGK